MIYRLTVPATIEDNAAVRILEWHVSPGERIERDDLLVELETHKALIEVRAGRAAFLRRRLFEEGQWCPLRGMLAVLSDTAGEPLEPTVTEWAADFAIS